MKPYKHPFAILLLLMLTIAGCTSAPKPQPVETTSSFINRQALLAHELEQSKELATALSHWQVILLLDPSHAEALQHQQLLKETLRKRSDLAFQSGLRALRSGNHKTAKKQFLATLAAEPSHIEAKSKLKEIQTARMMKAQQRKTSTEQQNAEQRSLTTSSTDLRYPAQQHTVDKSTTAATSTSNRINEWQELLDKKDYQTLIKRTSATVNEQNQSTVKPLLAQAHSAVIEDYISKNMLDEAELHFASAQSLLTNSTTAVELGNKLATAYHQNGRRLLTSDIDKGITYLQQSLKYNASNKHVQNLLKQSQLLKKRLSEIDAAQ